jgi:hypothetical protein
MFPYASDCDVDNSFSNFYLNFNGNVEFSSVIIPGDISTYPSIISTNCDRLNYAFCFYADVMASFQYISFMIDNAAYDSTTIFSSFTLLLLFCAIIIYIYLFVFVASRNNDNITVVFADCLFSVFTEYSPNEHKYYAFIEFNYGDFSLINCFFFLFSLLLFYL